MNYKKLLPIIGILILLYILTTLDLGEVYNVLSNINPTYSLISFLAIVPIVLLVNIQWQILLKKQRIKVSFIYSLKNIFIGYFYGFISPGGIGGYTRVLYLENESKSPLGKCLSNIIIFNTIDYLSMLLLGAIAAIILSSLYPYLFVLIIVMLIIVVYLFIFFLRKEKSKNFFLKIIQKRIFKAIKDRLMDSIDSFYEDLPRFKHIIIPFGISIIGWIVSFIELYLISKLFLIDVPFIYFILIIAIANVIASLPITIYGLGTREASIISMLSIFNIAPEKVLALLLFWFTIIWITPSIIGAVLTCLETKKLGKQFLNERTVERFSSYMKKFPELYRYLSNIVMKNIPKKVTKPVIVDLGAGPGLLSKELSKQIPNAEIIGIDPSDKMLKMANKNFKEDAFLSIQGMSEYVPLEKNSIDIVVSRFSLTYWKKPKDSFLEINRVLKPGGRFVLEALNKDFSKWKLCAINTIMFFKSAGLDVVRYHSDAYRTAFNMKQVEHSLKNSGFKIIYKEGSEKDWKFILVSEKK